jgi:hypothetical protein
LFQVAAEAEREAGEFALCRAQVSDTGAAAHAGISNPDI